MVSLCIIISTYIELKHVGAEGTLKLKTKSQRQTKQKVLFINRDATEISINQPFFLLKRVILFYN